MRQGDQSADRTRELTVIPSQRRSSVADSEVLADSARVTDGGPGYPVDGIIEKTLCQLHQKMAPHPSYKGILMSIWCLI